MPERSSASAMPPEAPMPSGVCELGAAAARRCLPPARDAGDLDLPQSLPGDLGLRLPLEERVAWRVAGMVLVGAE